MLDKSVKVYYNLLIYFLRYINKILTFSKGYKMKKLLVGLSMLLSSSAFASTPINIGKSELMNYDWYNAQIVSNGTWVRDKKNNEYVLVPKVKYIYTWDNDRVFFVLGRGIYNIQGRLFGKVQDL